MPGPFQGAELIILFILVLLILGPSKLPEIARNLGLALREFRRASSEAPTDSGPRAPCKDEECP